MNDERLRELLRSPDREEPAADWQKVAGNARRVAALRRRNRSGAVAVAMGLFIGGAVWYWQGLPRHGRGGGNEPLVKEPAQAIGGTSAAVEIDLMDPIVRAREEAASTMVFLAQRSAARVGAMETKLEYQRTVMLFPDSRGAAIARLELTKLAKEQQ